MNLSDFCHELWSEENVQDRLSPYWERLLQHTDDTIPEFLQPSFIEHYAPLCHFPEDYLPALLAVAQIVRDHPTLARWGAMLQYGLFQATPAIPLAPLPAPEKPLGDKAGLFQALVMVSTLPLIQQTHRKLGLPEHMMPDGATWIGGTCRPYQLAHHGQKGCPLGSWVRLQIDGKLFRVGRFEYLLQNWQTELPAVYLHKHSKGIAVLCRNQWFFDRRGLRVNPDKDPYDTVTHLEYRDNQVTGTPINVRGQAMFDQKLTLDLDEWDPLASAWDIVPSIHIPDGGGMTPKAVKDSLIQARAFFRDYLHLDLKAFGCSSWILNPAWERELPDSNFAALQRNVYLTPPELAPISGLYYAYGSNDANPLTEPCTTRLHQAFRNIFQRKEPLTWGGMFILTRDLEHFGTEYYRNNYR